MVLMRISQQENDRKQAEFLKNEFEFFRNWLNFLTCFAGRPCCDLATVVSTVGNGCGIVRAATMKQKNSPEKSICYFVLKQYSYKK
jgi:hypothetical protein